MFSVDNVSDLLEIACINSSMYAMPNVKLLIEICCNVYSCPEDNV